MTSAQLRADKQAFISNVDKFVEGYNNVLVKVRSLNDTFSSYEDTLLKNEILAKNENLATIIASIMSKVSSAAQAAIPMIDEEIKRLERQENEVRLRAKEKETDKEEEA